MGNFFKNRRGNDADGSPRALVELVEIREEDDLELVIPDMPEEISQMSESQSGNASTGQRPPNSDGSVFTFLGASGGVGATSLAVQTAYELAAQLKPTESISVKIKRPLDPQVCLIDLNFETGTCAHHLDLLPCLNHDDLSGTIEIDAAMTSAFTSTHGSGISLLAAPNKPGAAQHINPQSVMAILDAATKLYRYVVIDMPRQQAPWSLAVMGGSDFVGIVGELTIPSLHLTKLYLEQARSTFGEEHNIAPILSKYERRSFRNALSLSDAEAALDCKVWGTLCHDPDIVREAINCGEPVGALRKDSRYAKDSRKLVQSLLNLCELDAENNVNSAAA